MSDDGEQTREFLDYLTKKAYAGIGLPPEFSYLNPGDSPADIFDKMTRDGWGLDLISGKYYRK